MTNVLVIFDEYKMRTGTVTVILDFMKIFRFNIQGE